MRTTTVRFEPQLWLIGLSIAALGLSGYQRAASFPRSSMPSLSEQPMQNDTDRPTEKAPAEVERAKQSGAQADPHLITADNAFGLDLFRWLGQQAPDKNVFISPVSVALALQMTYNGAHGETRRQMAQTLQIRAMDLTALNQANAALLAGLSDAHEGVTLRIANALYLRQNLMPKPEFVQRSRDFYGAKLGDLSSGAEQINLWVKQQTNGKIQEIISPEQAEKTATLLLNAVYFKGAWQDPFEKTLTRDQDFHLPGGDKTPCKMMYRSANFSYLRGERFQAVRLPYGTGSACMMVMLPDEGVTPASLLNDMTADVWRKWRQEFADSPGDVRLPRFHVEYSAELKAPLTALGMTSAFDPGQADFSKMRPGLYLDGVLHKTYVEVNEAGTEAAAATAVRAFPTAVFRPRPQQRFTMIMDRPFLCAIVDERTNAFLFLGAIYRP